MFLGDVSSEASGIGDQDASILLQSLYGAVRAGRISTNAAATGVPPDTQDEAASSDANGPIAVNGDPIPLGDVSSPAEAREWTTVAYGQSVSVLVVLVGRRSIKKQQP